MVPPPDILDISGHENPSGALRPDSFFRMIKSVYPVEAATEAYARSIIRPVQVKQGDLLVKSGSFCDHLYFVEKGLLRGFIRQEKRDITTWITAENELVTSISSYYNQIPSIENIEAIEDALLWAIHRDHMQYMFSHFTEINVIVRIILEKYYQDAEERAYISRLSDASAKYHRFLNTRHHMLNRVPPRIIASYLDITEETLSRIRSRLSMLP
ncbi:MAG TPA: Crp/Fnr family transcriptional regulator [Chitinophagaceae bacterium]|nr:Crp/Fnr family transcriptional regulator [Chitinophagaceae bacterium]